MPSPELRLEDYCVPLLIGSTFGAAIAQSDTLIFGEHESVHSSANLLRSGTATLVRHQHSFYALTCAHVVDALDAARAVAQANWKRDTKTDRQDLGAYFFIPSPSLQFHFNRIFIRVCETDTSRPLDLAIARLEPDWFAGLGKKALRLRQATDQIPCNAVAVGFPEEARFLERRRGSNSLVLPFVALSAPLQTSATRLMLNAELEGPALVNWLSGISGGAVIGGNLDDPFLIGITTDGSNITGSVEGIGAENSILVTAQPVNSKEFEAWISRLPILEPEPSKSKFILHPCR